MWLQFVEYKTRDVLSVNMDMVCQIRKMMGFARLFFSNDRADYVDVEGDYDEIMQDVVQTGAPKSRLDSDILKEDNKATKDYKQGKVSND